MLDIKPPCPIGYFVEFSPTIWCNHLISAQLGQSIKRLKDPSWLCRKN
jgi:hypothetical protein